MTLRRFVTIVLAVALFKDFFDPQTFEGAVTTSAVGVAVVALISWATNRLYRLYTDRTTLEGRFSTKSLERRSARQTVHAVAHLYKHSGG